VHHIDIHVRDVAATRILIDAVAAEIGYRCRDGADDEFAGYEPVSGGRPRFGLLADREAGGTMRLAFSVTGRDAVDRAGALLRAAGAVAIEGPMENPEYGDDYYAVFFEDGDGNRFEILAD